MNDMGICDWNEAKRRADRWIAAHDADVRRHAADVTDAEVKAAMNEWDGHGYCCREGEPIVCMCGAKLKDRHEYDVHLLRAMLEEARKAVTE
ncbi:MAG: hypothetical protein SOI32_04320 [Bifidobacterium mongoliense]